MNLLLQIGLFLLQTFIHLFAACFLLRFYAFLCRINLVSSATGIGRFISALTDWAVLPLRQVLPRTGRLDLPSLLPALVGLLLLSGLKAWLAIGGLNATQVLLLFVVDTLRLMISLWTGVLIVQALLSWIQTASPVQYVLNQITEPILKPIRRRLPLVGGIDLSPLVALLILQVLSMLLQGISI